MKTKNRAYVAIALFVIAGIICLSGVSAMIIDSVNQDKIYPGNTGSVSVEIKNTLNDDVEDVEFNASQPHEPKSNQPTEKHGKSRYQCKFDPSERDQQ